MLTDEHMILPQKSLSAYFGTELIFLLPEAVDSLTSFRDATSFFAPTWAYCPMALLLPEYVDEQLKLHVRKSTHSPLFVLEKKTPPPCWLVVLHDVNVVSSMNIRLTLVLLDETAPPLELLAQSWNKQFETQTSLLLGTNGLDPAWFLLLYSSKLLLLSPKASENCAFFDDG